MNFAPKSSGKKDACVNSECALTTDTIFYSFTVQSDSLSLDKRGNRECDKTSLKIHRVSDPIHRILLKYDYMII